jgi:hypothetical protein
VLRRSQVDSTIALVLGRMRAEDARLLGRLFARNTADDLLHALLVPLFRPLPVLPGTVHRTKADAEPAED